MRNRLGVAVASLVAALTPAAAAPTPPDAKATVDRIYRSVPREDFDYTKILYAPLLKRLLAQDAANAKGEVGLIDSDSFCDCQDTEKDYGFTTSSRPVGAGRAEVTVHLHNGERSLYRIDMVRLPAGWAVADVHGPEHASLTGWLRANLK